jgi:hypothetical protein
MREAKRFKTVADLAAATGAEPHGVELDYDIFENVSPPDPQAAACRVSRGGLRFPLKSR